MDHRDSTHVLTFDDAYAWCAAWEDANEMTSEEFIVSYRAGKFIGDTDAMTWAVAYETRRRLAPELPASNQARRLEYA